MHKNVFILIIPFLCCLSCRNNKSIVRSADYDSFLVPGKINEEVSKVKTEIDFWKPRLQNDTGSYICKLELGRYHLALFRLTGDVWELHKGDSLIKNSSAKLNHTVPEILYSLSQNSITRHEFFSAAAYNDKAEKAQGDLYTIRLLQFDTDMELGKYKDAYRALRNLKDKTSFDFLIRKAKWEDHMGNQEEAIRLMEQAFEKVRNKKKSLYCWTLSNLGDMYGHAGKVNRAYRAYLNVLKQDPSNLYCLKGIAWIAYSHDRNYAEAKKILRFILSQTEMPDLRLILADIAGSENDQQEKMEQLNNFISVVSGPGYGDMYNKNLIGIYSGDFNEKEKAVSLAYREMNRRFTPETCDWFAWTNYKKGNLAEAYEWSKKYVYKFSYEPEAMMHTAFIFADNGRKKEAKDLFLECLKSSFELGPLATEEIKGKLNSF